MPTLTTLTFLLLPKEEVTSHPMFLPHREGEYDPNESITTLGYAFTGDLSLILTLSLMFDEYINRWIESGLVSKNILKETSQVTGYATIVSVDIFMLTVACFNGYVRN